MRRLSGIHLLQETRTNSTKSSDELHALSEGTIVEPHQHLSLFQNWVGITILQNDGKPLASRCCTKPSIAWWPSLWSFEFVHSLYGRTRTHIRCTRHVDQTHLSSCSHLLMPTHFCFSQQLLYRLELPSQFSQINIIRGLLQNCPTPSIWRHQ